MHSDVVSERGRSKSRERDVTGTSLAWRAFLVNAPILVGSYALYVVTPATISSPIAVSELIVLVSAVVVSLFVNLLLLQRTFAPLERLIDFMRRVDPLEPGQRMPVEGGDPDVRALAATLNEMLARLEDERRESARRAVRAQEIERMRVARELHDGLGQSMSGILLLVDELARESADGTRETLEMVREATRTGLEEVRRIARDLRPEALEDLGLLRALEALATLHRTHTRSRVLLHVPERLPKLSLEQELVVYRITQEALTNVGRHAEASKVVMSVEVREDNGRLRVEVRDNGRGFAQADADGGVMGMRERALLVRGQLEVRSELGHGTTVCLELPLDVGT